jgi:hypothetical protein
MVGKTTRISWFVRGAKQPDPDHPDPNLVIVGDVLPLLDKQTGEIEYVVPRGCGAARRHDTGKRLSSR